MIDIIFGPQGAGKTTYARKLIEKNGGLTFSIDEWMKVLYGPDFGRETKIEWIMDRVLRCESLILSTALDLLKNEIPIVLDLGLTSSRDRQRVADFFNIHHVNYQFHYLHAPYDIRFKRITERNVARKETFSFEVTPEMFNYMDAAFQAPENWELVNLITVDQS